MARNFLRVSKTYCASTSEDLQQMDDAVARVLGASFKTPKGAREELMEKLVAELPGATPIKLNARVRMLRTAYAMLIGRPTPTHQEDVRKGYASAAGYLALKQDGITTWEQVVQLLAEESEAPKVKANVLMQVSATHVLVRRDEFEALLDEQRAARATLEEAMRKIVELEQKLGELEPVAVEEVSLKDHLPTVQPAAPALPEATSGAAPRPADVMSLLPTRSRYRGEGREVRYEKVFRDKLRALQEHERRRVVERVIQITEDSKVPGLRIKPLTPPHVAAKYGGKPLSARATSHIRIVFKPNGQLLFVDILRKGDIPRTSEA